MSSLGANMIISRCRNVLIAIVVLVASVSRAWSEAPKRVAVLADATALGVGQQARLNAWPMQLGRMLGHDWIAGGFARGAASLDPSAQRFILQMPEWSAIKAFDPDVVVVSLGASDAVDATFKASERVPAGLDQVLDAIAALPKKPTMYLCLPPPPSQDWRRAAAYELATGQLIEMLKEAARRHSVAIIDTRTPLLGQDKHLISGYLPDAEGGRLVAGAVCKTLVGRDVPADVGPYRRSDPPRGLVLTEFIRDGEPIRARGAEKWTTKDGAIEAPAGGGNVLLAPIDTGIGDFRMLASVWIEGGERNGPRFGIDGNWISLENMSGNVVADGEAFRSRPYIARATDIVKRGAWMTLEVRRVGVDLEFIADDELLVVVPVPGDRFMRFGLDPQGAKFRVRSWTVETEPSPTRAAPASTAPQPVSPAPASSGDSTQPASK